MLSVAAIGNSGAAASYYETKDDYYQEGASAPSEWVGEAAKTLGLEGKTVDQEQFKELMDGKVEDQQVGTYREGELQHRAGYDLTFSAPKSVSLLAEVAGDDRLIAAHDAAVKEVLGRVEREHLVTRMRTGDKVETDNTGSMIAATFRHDTSREKDPQLHTHAVVLNLTKTDEDKWRSIESREIFRNKKSLGLEYRQALAEKVQELGYDIRSTTVGKNDWGFEIQGIDNKTLDAFSQRSQQIEDALSKRGETRDTASAASKEVAALDSRSAKDKDIDRGDLKKHWQNQASELGADLSYVKNMSILHQSSSSPLERAAEDKVLALDAVKDAIEHLSERETNFDFNKISDAAWRFADGKTTREAIDNTIQSFAKDGTLIERGDVVDRNKPGASTYTTQKAINTEKTMVRIAKRGAGEVQAGSSSLANANSVVANAEKKSNELGYNWTDDQRKATTHLLSSRDRVAVVQGAAGSAKTSTVISTYAAEMTKQGYDVKGFAPTHAAAKNLGKAGGIKEVATVQKWIRQRDPQPDQDQKTEETTKDPKQVWIVDEAGMMSARDTRDLLAKAEKNDARVVLVGDEKQLSSIGAGSAFSQLQKNIGAIRLDEIVRQKDQQLKAEVETAYKGEASAAIQSLNQRGKVTEADDPDRLHAKLIDKFATMDKQTRDKTLIVAPLHRHREAINSGVQSVLREKGEVGKERATFTTIRAKSLTNPEKKLVNSYESGDRVRFSREMKRLGIAKDEILKVGEQTDRGTLTLTNKDGREIDWDPAKKGSGSGRVEVFQSTANQFSVGDKIVTTTKSENITSKTVGVVKAVRDEIKSMTIELANGKSVDVKDIEDMGVGVDLGYAQTGHAVQGQTSENVLISLDSNTPLASQQMAYVALSRAEYSAEVYTDDLGRLQTSLDENSGEKDVAATASEIQKGLSEDHELGSDHDQSSHDAADNHKEKGMEFER